MRIDMHVFPERPPSREEIEAFAAENGYVPNFGAVLPRPITREMGYQIVFLVPTFTGAQIIIGGLSQVEGISERYDYGHLFDAVVSYGEWHDREWADEPFGWLRHKPSNRRRSYETCVGVSFSPYAYEETVRE